MKKGLSKEKGFLLIMVIIMIFILGFLVVTISHLVTSESSSTLKKLYASEAFYNAESGLHYAATAIANASSGLSVDKDGCVIGLTAYCDGNWKDSVAFENGYFRFKCNYYCLSDKGVNLTSEGFTAASTTIPVNTVSGYAPEFGQIIVAINTDYEEKMLVSESSTDSGVCGFEQQCSKNPWKVPPDLIPCPAPCFFHVIRGFDGTIAEEHPSGASAYQDQINIESEGVVPNFTDPLGKRNIKRAAKFAFSYNYNGFAVGTDALILSRSDATTWTGTSPTPPLTTATALRGISCIDKNDCWAVAAATTNNIIRWNGTAWAYSSPSNSWNLYGISCPTSGNCVAVGGLTMAPTKMSSMKSTGGSWEAINPGSLITVTALSNTDGQRPSVSCPLTTNNCWAVGGTYSADPKNFAIASFSGGVWSSINNSLFHNDVSALKAVSIPLTSIDCYDSNNCMAVGGKLPDKTSCGLPYSNLKDYPLVVRYQSGSWSCVDTKTPGLPTQPLYGVTCTAANNCWAVGAAGTIVHYDGSSWAPCCTGTTCSGYCGGITVNKQLYSVRCTSANDCYAVGAVDGTPVILQWNGTAWSRATTASTKALYGVAVFPKELASITTDPILWTESLS